MSRGSPDAVGPLTSAGLLGGGCLLAAGLGALDTFTFDDDRVTVVGVVKDRIVDPQNAYQIADHFTYSSNASEAQALLQ